MSRLSKLITELCPDGVQYATLGQIASFRKGATKARADMQEGPYPVVAGGLEPAFYCNEFNRAGETIAVSSSGVNAGFVSYWNSPIMLTDAFSVEPDEEVVVTKYLYYALANMQLRIFSKKKGAGVPHVYSTDISTLRIPLPPLAIQHEIVRVLDQFTGLITELEAELAARKKQYDYYRKLLLTFDDSVIRVPLGEIGRISMCKRILKAETSPSGDVPFFKIGTFGGKPDAFITFEKYEEYRKTYPFPKKGDVLISASGTIGRTLVYDGSPAYFQDSNIVWVDNDESIVLNKFLYHYYSLQPWSVSTGGTIDRLYTYQLSKTPIPVPPLSEQERIVSILDRFDALVNDLSSGIPAEIEARRKQYEYYRDKLLSFKEAKR